MYQTLFSRHGLSLERLRAFLETAEAGGIAKAVGPDAVRQSQYSRQIAELQEFFGVELMARRGKGLLLTAAGERLAALIRASLTGLSDFALACAGEPLHFHIGAGDSLLQWLVLPKMGQLRREFPAIDFSLHNRRTSEIISGLRDLRLDFGLVRRDAVKRPLASRSIGILTYALYSPRALIQAQTPLTLEWALGNLPIASQSSDGQFTRRLYEIAEEKGRNLRISLGCETFPQALQALVCGQFAAILPRLAIAGLDPKHYVEIPCPELATEIRQVVLAWNPRLMHIRGGAEKVALRLKQLMRF